MKKLLLSSILVAMILLPFVGQATEPEKTYTFLAPLSTDVDQKTPISSDLPGYLQDMFKIVLGVAGVLAVIMIMRGGIMYITAGDKESSVSEAKDIIRAAIFGLLLAIMSFLIIQTLNPDALNLSVEKQSSPAVEQKVTSTTNNLDGTKNSTIPQKETYAHDANLPSGYWYLRFLYREPYEINAVVMFYGPYTSQGECMANQKSFYDNNLSVISSSCVQK